MSWLYRRVYILSTDNLQSVAKIISAAKKYGGFHEDKELAEWLGVSNKVLSAWKSRGKIADYGVFIKRGFSVDWLRTGSGDMLATVQQMVSLAKLHECEDRRTADNDDYINVPRYEIQASAGGGAMVQSEQIVDYLQFRPDWLKASKGITADNLVLISVVGDSMEPTISDGDQILVDTTEGRFKSDAVYVLQQGDRLWVKRVHYKLDGTVMVKSDNASKYEPELFRGDQLDALRIIGRVVWRGGDL